MRRFHIVIKQIMSKPQEAQQSAKHAKPGRTAGQRGLLSALIVHQGITA